MMPRRHPKRARRRAWQELRERRGQGIFLLPSLLTTICFVGAGIVTTHIVYRVLFPLTMP